MNYRRVGILAWIGILLSGLAISVNTTGPIGLLVGSLVSAVAGAALSTYRPVS